MNRLSKYFLICIDPIISQMDKDFDDDFSEINDDHSFSDITDGNYEVIEEQEAVEEQEAAEEQSVEEIILAQPEERPPNEEDDIDDVDDEIYAHKPIHDESIINGIIKSRLFAYSTFDNRRVASSKIDWATIARLSDIGMDRIFIDGKEVFVSGFNKISLKTAKNITLATEKLKSRGLHDYAKRIEQLRC
jgi:hypothetical protein